MTITATIEQEIDQGDGTKNVLVRFDDDVDGSVSRLSSTIPTSTNTQTWATQKATEFDSSKAQTELDNNFALVGQGQNATTLAWVRNTEAVGEEWICKGASNQTDAQGIANFAHIHREYSNPTINNATGFTNAQRQQWSGQAQALETSLNNYNAGHAEDPAKRFDGFPDF